MRRPAMGRPARSTPVPLAVGLLLLLLGLLLQRTTTATTTVSTSTPSAAAFAPPPPPRFGRRSFITAQHQQNLQRPRPRHQRAPPAFASPSGADAPLLTRAEIEACAADFGIELSLTTLGPFYRVVARLAGEESSQNTEPMGYTEGFVAPLFGLVHLDTMQVRRRYWKQLQKEGKRQFRFGCGVLLGALAMRHAYDCGCKKAELLAINDDERTHALLKAFYRTAGFVEVKEVTQDLACVPDLLVWGGVGTRMDMPVAEFLRRWRPMILSRGVEFKGGDG